MHFPAERPVLARQIITRLEELLSHQYRASTPLADWQQVVAGTKQDVTPIPMEGWRPYRLGDTWGGQDITCWFRASVAVPRPGNGDVAVLLLDPGGESLCFLNGEPIQGLDVNRREIVLPRRFWGKTVQVVLQSYSSPSNSNTGARRFVLAAAAVRDETLTSLYWDLKVAFDAANALDNDSLDSQRLLDHVERCVKGIDLNGAQDVAAFNENLARVQAEFDAGMKQFQGSHGMGKALLVGQSHIDTAWTWPLRETRRKVARTFSTVLNYMEQYPDYVFFQSQPQLYEWVKEHHPSLWKRIVKQARAGKWEPNGASWVEQDTNVPSGESHVRQFLYGNRFFRKEFGVHTRVFWLPDCFGFSFAMPQILKKAGIEAFATTKLASNEYNEFPYSLFRWRGLDGSEVLAYQMPWEWRVTPAHLLAHWNRFKQKTATDELPLTYGIGDGGGGPTVEMLENGPRLGNVRGFPRTQAGTFQSHFDRLQKNVNWQDLPVYADELYYEKHRGCQTTQARTKRNNRKSELALREAEFLASCDLLSGGAYPQAKLDSAWKLVLLNQFHDILPGSSIAEVYEDAERDYGEVRETVEKVVHKAIGSLATRIDTRGDGTGIVVWNALGWTRDDVATVEIPEGGAAAWGVLDGAGNLCASQPVSLPDGRKALLFEARNLPPMGYSVFRLAKNRTEARSSLRASAKRLENRFFRIDFAKTGAISRIWDKVNRREVVAKGSLANDLILFDDFPASNDAWDIDFNFADKATVLDDVKSVTVTENGPVRSTIRIVKKTPKSTITQDISLWASIPRVDFVTQVDWQEKHKLLKASFPVNVLSRSATYEIQFGAIERPTHRSSSFERARFEVPGHKWIDLSEGDYGVSLLNDCKYGFDVLENTMRISLLRASVAPDPHADEGHHAFTYSLYPHTGGWREAETVKRAQELNSPVRCWLEPAHPGKLPPKCSFVATDSTNVVIDTVKKAEDSDAVIVRVYEAHGARGGAALEFFAPPSRVTECDLMEENDVEVSIRGRSVSFDFKPWEIRTFKVVFPRD